MHASRRQALASLRWFSTKTSNASKASKASKAKNADPPFQSALVDESRLPFMKWVVGDATWQRFLDKKATTEERKRVIEALNTFLPRRSTQLVALGAAKATLDAQSVISMIRGKGAETPADLLEALKPEIIEYFGVEESQYQQAVREVLKVLEAEKEGDNKQGTTGETIKMQALVANPSMNDIQRAQVQATINEITR